MICSFDENICRRIEGVLGHKAGISIERSVEVLSVDTAYHLRRLEYPSVFLLHDNEVVFLSTNLHSLFAYEYVLCTLKTDTFNKDRRK